MERFLHQALFVTGSGAMIGIAQSGWWFVMSGD